MKHYRRFMKYGDPLKVVFKSRHGNNRKQNPNYEKWRGIKKRCYTPSNSAYPNYGARGIGMYERWADNVDGFELFDSYIRDLNDYRKPGYSLDRIDNDGNYEPGNLRWVDRQTQNLNTRRTTKNKMVNIYERNGCYRVMISRKGTRIPSRQFDTLEEAIEYRDNKVKGV